jgi:hypothetical protein
MKSSHFGNQSSGGRCVRALRIAGMIGAGLVVAAAATVGIGEYAWRRSTNRLLDSLADRSRQRAPDAGPPFSRTDLAGLPAPVARYVAFALPKGQRRIRAAHVRWTGDMRLQPDAEWSPFAADQHFTTAAPGFVWDARVRMIPLVPVFVRDSYVSGEGRTLGMIGAVAKVVNEGGTPEMAQGALARWLGEAAWFPTAFLPGEGVSWTAIDDSTARASVTDGAVRVTGDFHFAATGELLGMSGMRYRDVNGRGVLTPFEGRYTQFAPRDGMMMPSRAEVAWLLPQGRYTYWRGQPMDASYDLALTSAARQ